MNKQFTLIAVLCSVPLIAVLCFLLAEKSNEAVRCQQETIHALKADSIRYITLYPYHKTYSLLDDSIIIRNRQTIARVVNAYKHMRPQQAGDGRLDGSWQVTLTFTSYHKQEITSDIYHTEYSDLVFISTPVRREITGISDVLSSRDISQVLLDVIAQKQKSELKH
jgi:hypothetical protein